MPPKLYLIDGHALAYRTYFALTKGGTGGDRWITRQGEPTAGVYGFTSVLLKILEQERPDYIMVVFDLGRTFRDDLYPAYKGTRSKMPDELATQIERIRQLVDAFNIPRLEMEGYEADDILGCLAKKAVQRGLGVKIITGDRDLLQLVDDRIIVSLPGKSLADSKDYRAQDVLDYMGVRPDQVVDFKALTGDKSDNIPGVAGIGDKTAASLLETYGTLDNIYEHLEELPAGVRKRLETSKDSAYLSRKLAALVTDLDVPLDLEHARADQFDQQVVEEIFRTLEFRSLLGRLTGLTQANQMAAGKTQQLSLFNEAAPASASEPFLEPLPTADKIQVHIIDTPEALAELAAKLAGVKTLAIDTETTSTDPMRADLVGISMAVEEGQAYYIPVGHITGEKQLPLEAVQQALRAAFCSSGLEKIGHNLKYDYIMLARHGLEISPLKFDTMIAEWVTNPTSRNLGLKNLAWVRLNVKMTEIHELIGKGKTQRSMAEVEIPVVAAYAADDAEVLLRLRSQLQDELEKCQGLALFDEIEMPLVCVLADMEMAGIGLDRAYLDEMSGELSTRLQAIEAEIYAGVGSPFNLNSPVQLSEALFNKLGLMPPDRTAKTSTGFYSTAAEVLEALKGAHPVVDLVLEYRELSKLKSTYVDALPEQINPRTTRVHTTFSQTGSVTGRLASSEPNIQNIPIRNELGRRVRHAFVAAPGNLLLSVDYSQVELRIVAHMSQDQAMLAAFQSGQDIHTATAAAIYGVAFESVTGDMRRRAKGVNFGLIYGMSAFGLTRYTDLTLAEAEDFVRAYFRQFPGVKNYLDGIRRLAADQGYVETLLGRRRYFPGLKFQRNINLRNREEREAINAPIQGTAADIMKIAMLNLPPAMKEAGLQGKILLQVHDELVLECPEAEVRPTVRLVRRVMEDAYPLDAPLKTEARIGPNWYDMSPVHNAD